MKEHIRKLQAIYGTPEQTQSTENKDFLTQEQAKKINDYYRRIKHRIEIKMPDFEEIRSLFDQKYFELYGRDFDTSENGHILISILKYFVKDQSFSALNPMLSLNKGLFLMGECGVGKTSIIRTLHDIHPGIKFGINSCISLVEKYNSGDQDVVRRFSKKGDFYFDDFGSEDTAKFGVNIMKSILESRYYDMSKTGHKTFISTNLGFDEITEKYGHRISSRIFEMFNIFQFTGEDMRKKI